MVKPTIEIEYRKAFSELEIILENLDEDQKKLIPRELLENISREKDLTYNFVYNNSKDLMKQNILPQTKALLVEIYEQFLADESERLMWEKYDMYCYRVIEEKKREQFDQDDIFKAELTNDNEFSISGNDDLVYVNYDSSQVTEENEKVDDKVVHPENYSNEEKLGIENESNVNDNNALAPTNKAGFSMETIMNKTQNIIESIINKIKELLDSILKKVNKQDQTLNHAEANINNNNNNINDTNNVEK